MGDGELVLEGSPFHQYLQEIGWDETPVVLRADNKLTESNNDIMFKCINVVKPALFNGQQLIKRQLKQSVRIYSDDDLSNIRNQVHPYLLEPHKIHLSELESPSLCKDNTSSSYFVHSIFMMLIGLAIPSVYWYVFCSVIGLSYLLYLTSRNNNKKVLLGSAIKDYCISIIRLKQASKVLLSYLRDCQIARTSYAAGVTWNKLDKLEESVLNLEQKELRTETLLCLKTIYKVHQNVFIEAMRTSDMMPDLDLIFEQSCLQMDGFLQSIDSEIPTSHSLRYYLKLIEHTSSEVLWRLAVGTIPSSWKNDTVSEGFITKMLHGLTSVKDVVEENSISLEDLYQKSKNNIPKELPHSSHKSTDIQSNSQTLHNLQLLHSSLNIATLRCLDTYSYVSQLCTDEAGDQTSLTDENLLEHSKDITSILSLVQLNVDMAQNILQAINNTLNPAKTEELDLPMGNDATEVLCDTNAIPEQIIPYVQQGNLVFSGEGGELNFEDGDDFSDEDFALIQRRNGEERKMMLTELKHVIDTKPTCLYEDDYQEFKKTGLLNPKKEDLRETFEDESEDEEDNTDLRKNIFNPFSFQAMEQIQKLTSMNSLQNELLQFDEYEGEGDVSDESCGEEPTL